MSHPNKRQKVQGNHLSSASISALSKVRQQQHHDALQETLRSGTGQGKKTKFLSESPEPAGRSIISPPASKLLKGAGTPEEPLITNGGINDIEAIELRRKNEKARRRQERKKRKLAEKEKAHEEAEDGGYSSWNGFSDGPEPESNATPPRKIHKRFLEEAVVLEKPAKASKEKKKRSKSPPTTDYILGNTDLEKSPKQKRRWQQENGMSYKSSLKPSTKLESPTFPAVSEDGNTEPILSKSLFAPSAAQNPAKSASQKIESVWDRLKSKPKESSTRSSTDSSRVSLGSEDPASENSITTADSGSKPSPELQTDSQTPQREALPQNKVYKNLPLQGGMKDQRGPPLQNKLYKNVLSKNKAKAEQEVGNDSTAGLVDPLTPVPPKPLVKSKDQISRELQAVRKSLPIWGFQDEIRTTVRDSDTMVLVGETGSGKSTQIGQFLLNQPYISKMISASGKKYGGCIAITQPRRVAAISLAQRVSSEMGTTLGKEVGYCVRFDNVSDHSTKIRYITDGMLLNEILHDPELSRYSAVVVDEAHERSVSTDLGMGLLKGIVESRRKKKVPLKLIVMSATLNVEKMASYVGGNPKSGETSEKFPPAPICRIPGKIFPVEVFYTPASIDNFQTAAAKTIFQVHYQQPCPGDILVFSTGSEEIEELASMVEELALQMEPDKPKLNVMRLYASLDPIEQQKVFIKGNPKERKVIIATNIAETSVTVPGVRHVIDCGKVKMKRFRHQLGIESLLVTDISQASAQQRKGRAGREAPGTCYRLYTEDYFKKLQKDTEPDILHCDLAGAMLTLLAMKSENSMSTVNDFPFLDGPSHQSRLKALTTLHELGAIGDNGNISDVGRKMSKFPLPPVQSRVIVAASEEEKPDQNSEENVLVDVIDVLSCLSVDGNIILQPTRWKKTLAEPKEKSDPLLSKRKKRRHGDEEDSDEELTLEEKVQSRRMELVHPSGDHITYLNILRRYLSKRPNEQKKFCQEYQISYPLMRKVENIRKQLRGYCRLDKVGDLPRDNDMQYESDTMVARYPRVTPDQAAKILRCFMKGVGVENIAKRTQGRSYRTLTSTGNTSSGVDMSVHPSSCLMWERNESEAKRSKKDVWGDGGRDREQSKLAQQKEGFGEAVMYQDVVWTSKAFMKCVSKIKLAWTAEVFENLTLFSQ
ncbi:putative ATP-dependent RNA helicase dhr2 [Orbilia javanica]|uniref:RNA helicase n=1 Tax=Orbilia javanica TaxID=47235 RepID=A0AAN8MXT3_9PEZI